MTTPIHPELDRLLAEYNRIVDSYEASDISLDEATSSLSRLTVTDGAGWVWGVDPSTGLFTRAAPDGIAQPADAADFAANQIPYDAPASTSPLLQPPSIPSSSPYPGDQDQPGHDHFTPPPPPPSRRAATPSSKKSRPGRAASSGGFFTGNRRLIIIVAVIAVIVAIALLTHKASPGTSTSTLPPASSTTSSLPINTTVPVTTTPAQSASVPTTTQMNAVFVKISSGTSSVTNVLSAVASPGTHIDVVQHVAFFSGLGAVGAHITFGAPHKISGGATTTFTIYDGASGPVLYRGHAVWAVRSGVWKLATWPVFS